MPLEGFPVKQLMHSNIVQLVFINSFLNRFATIKLDNILDFTIPKMTSTRSEKLILKVKRIIDWEPGKNYQCPGVRTIGQEHPGAIPGGRILQPHCIMMPAPMEKGANQTGLDRRTVKKYIMNYKRD